MILMNTLKRMAESSAANGTVSNQEVTMVLSTLMLTTSIPLAMPTPTTDPTTTCVVDTQFS